MNSSDHGMELRFLVDENIFVEKLDIIDSIFYSLVAFGSQSVQQVELSISH